MMKTKNELKEIKEKHGLGNAELMRIMGIKERQLYDYLNGKAIIPKIRMDILRITLGVIHED